MNMLFLHPNFPGQQSQLAYHFANTGEHKVVYLSQNHNGNQLKNVQVAMYKPAREVAKDLHHYERPLEEAILNGQAVYRAAAQLRSEGFAPDLITGHTGWGSTMYLKELYPQVPLIGYFEWFYHSYGVDSGYWPDEVVTDDSRCRIRTQNAHHLLCLDSCDAGYCPTTWQRSQFPGVYQPKLEVIHDGINTDGCRPKLDAKLVLPELQLDLSEASEIVTYVSRGFEPYRGFPQFMEAMRLLLKNRPQCHVVLVGTDRTYYGAPPEKDKTYKQLELEKGGLDMQRVHFTGPLPRNRYLEVLQASTVHVYLTRPFILSWSMLEAMAAGVCLVASATPPVQEIVEDNVNGLLANFRSPSHICDRIEEALDDAALRRRLSVKARETIVERYELDKMLRKQVNFIYSHVK